MQVSHTHEFFSVRKEEADSWIEALKQHVVFLDLKQELVVKTLLGKGNSAKVHQCERKYNPEEIYALKTINKSYITAKEQNKVSEIDDINKI